MIELPHAVVKADDPLKTPEKFATIPESGAYTDAPVKKNKKPFLAFLRRSRRSRLLWLKRRSRRKAW